MKTELTTVDKAKQALLLGCGVTMSPSFDIQSGWAWHVKAQDFSRVTRDLVWLNLGFVSGDDRRVIEAYAKSIGRPMTEKVTPRNVWPKPLLLTDVPHKPSRKKKKKGARAR